MSWSLLEAQAFHDRHDLWEDLNAAGSSHPFLSARYVGAAVRHFADSSVRLAANDEPGAEAMVLLTRSRGGLLWRTYRSMAQPLAAAVWRTRVGLPHLRGLFRALPPQALRLSFEGQDPLESAIVSIREGGSVERIDEMETGGVRLKGSQGGKSHSR